MFRSDIEVQPVRVYEQERGNIAHAQAVFLFRIT